jgi:small subunit ribosomal protein S16
VAVKIRLLRMGKIRNPQYRIVVADARTKRDGRAIEYVGLYHPKEEPSRIEVNSERVQYWLSVGAQPSEPVQRILEKTGDWQKFKGLPAPEPLKVAVAKVDRTAVYEAEAQAAAGLAEPKPAKKAERAERSERKAEPRAAKKAAAPAATAPPAAAPAATAPPAAAPSATAPAAAEPSAAEPSAAEAGAAEPSAAEAGAAEPTAPTTEEKAGADAGNQG